MPAVEVGLVWNVPEKVMLLPRLMPEKLTSKTVSAKAAGQIVRAAAKAIDAINDFFINSPKTQSLHSSIWREEGNTK
jgi:hypothetical protein